MLIAPSLHVLCFGDSLTQGYSASNPVDHPYSIALQASLERAFPTWTVTTDNQGVGGDQVTSPPGRFLPRMQVLYEEVHPTDPYTIAVVLGGTNDLSQNREPDTIFPALQEVWNIPLSHGTTILSLTIPECGDCAPPSPERRKEVNQRILAHEEDNFHTLDLEKLIPYFSMPNEERKIIWEDSVHFTPLGYDRMGNLIANAIIEILGGSQASSHPPQPISQTPIKPELRKREPIMQGKEIHVKGRTLREIVGWF